MILRTPDFLTWSCSLTHSASATLVSSLLCEYTNTFLQHVERAFPPVVPSARKAVPSDICMTSWRPLLTPSIEMESLWHLSAGNYIFICLLSVSLNLDPSPTVVCSKKAWLLPVLCTVVSSTTGRLFGTKFLINVLKWISEWIYTVIWKEKYFLIFL